MSEFDGELSAHINNQFSNYTCKDSQNEMISLVACHIKNKTLPKSGEYYSLIADETMDLSKIEQVCVCLRYSSYCHAHKLNLPLCDASIQIDDVADTIKITECISVFVRKSAKRHALFEHIKKWFNNRKIKTILSIPQ